MKSQTEVPQSIKKSYAQKTFPSFHQFPYGLASSHLRLTSEDFAGHPLGRQAGDFSWLKDKQTLWVSPRGSAEDLLIPFPQGKGNLSLRVWGRLSVEQPVALVRLYLDFRSQSGMGKRRMSTSVFR